MLVFVGHGWGHGIGMSQYGAYGYAQHGWTYDQILAHYYTGTTLGPAPTNRVRVLLAQGKASLSVSSKTPFKLTDGSKTARTLPAGTYTLGPGPAVKLNPAKHAAGDDRHADLRAGRAAGSRSGSARSTAARWSSRLVAGKLQAVNTLGLDAYVQGVVSREMPASWDAEALDVQAVAARSYALANLNKSGSFDVYSDTRSQVYGGVAAEEPSTNQAVEDTAGQVVLYDGKVADTLFFVHLRAGAPPRSRTCGPTRRPSRTSSPCPTRTTRSRRTTTGARPCSTWLR